MLSVSEMRRRLGDGDWVVVTPDGDFIDMEIPRSIGPATVLVRPVTDALKRVEGVRIADSVSRDEVWVVDGFALNRVVIERLSGELTAEGLYEAVSATPLSWQVYEI